MGETHWDGLPAGAGRRVTTGDDTLPSPRRSQPPKAEAGLLHALLNRAAANIEVGRRPLSVYDELTGARPFTAPAKEAR